MYFFIYSLFNSDILNTCSVASSTFNNNSTLAVKELLSWTPGEKVKSGRIFRTFSLVLHVIWQDNIDLDTAQERHLCYYIKKIISGFWIAREKIGSRSPTWNVFQTTMIVKLWKLYVIMNNILEDMKNEYLHINFTVRLRQIR